MPSTPCRRPYDGIPAGLPDTLQMLEDVMAPGALRNTGCQQLLEQAVRLPFTDQPAVVGPYGVQQHYAAVTEFASSSLFRQLWGAFQTLLEQHLA